MLRSNKLRDNSLFAQDSGLGAQGQALFSDGVRADSVGGMQSRRFWDVLLERLI